MQIFSFFVLIVIFSTSIGKYLLVDLGPKQEVSKDWPSGYESCKGRKCGESCRPPPYREGACDDNQQCVLLRIHPGCKRGPFKSGGEGNGEVYNIASINKSDRAVKPFDHSNPPSLSTPLIVGGVCFCDGIVQKCSTCRDDASYDGKVSRCSDFRCPDERGGMCLREGASGCGAGERCCDGLQCHSKTAICLGKGVTIRETLVKTRGCTECKGSCCDLSLTRKLNGTSIATKIKMKPRCADCKGSCCDFFSTMDDPNPIFQKGVRFGEPVQVQMQPRCMDCRRIECCDWGRSVNVKQTTMISYL